MHPILFEFGPLKVYSYGLMVACALIVTTFLVKLEAVRQGYPAEKILNLSLCVAISGILGARILYILQNLEFYIDFPFEIIMLHKGGLSFYGGFILATICATIFLKRQGWPILKTLDIFAPYLALGQAIGRIGCFLNGCCYGLPSTAFLSVYFPGEGIPRHPVQIYASFNLLLIFVVLKVFQAKRIFKVRFSSQTFLLYCLLYSISRFFMEYLRGDNLRIFANLTVHQIVSLGIFVISGLFLWKK